MYKPILSLDEKPFCFFRGEKPCNSKRGVFYTNCFAEAKGFSNNGNVIKCHIQTESPLIIDATTLDGYDPYGGIEIEKVRIYPESARAELKEFASSRDDQSYLGTDDLRDIISTNKKYDCVIIKNIREGILNFPVYVVIVTNINNLYDIEDITNSSDDFSEWTKKRIRLSDFINSSEWNCKEEDGILCIRHYQDFSIEDSIVSVSNTEYKIVNNYVFLSDFKIVRIKSLLLNRYIKGVQEGNGQYKCDLVDGSAIFDTFNGRVSISDIPILPSLRKDAVFIVENAEI